MKNIFDPVNQWLGKPPLALASGNKRPVALDDTLSLLKDSGSVNVAVLSNDFDPEGQAITLLSAFASLGTAVAEADNTVTYTPPAGLSGFDTVVYTIEDDLGQTQNGQINVTITEPQLSIVTQPDNTLVVNAETGLIDITVTNPAEFTGTYQADIASLASGPVNLVPPSIAGTPGLGNVLTAAPGLWIYDTGAGTITESWQWRRAGVDISGATAPTYTMGAADLGLDVTTLQVQSDDFGQRIASSAAVNSGFNPASDTQILGWWDASDTATLTESGGRVSVWADKTGGAAFTQSAGVRQPFTDNRTLNGQNVLNFDGTQFMERLDGFPSSGNTAFHMALVIDSISNAFEAVLAIDAANNDFQIDAEGATQFDGRLNAAGIGPSTSLTGGPFSGALILSAVFDFTGGTAEVFISDTSRGSTGYTTAIDSTAALHLMTNRSQNAWINGAVAELVITEDVSNRADHHAYLASKWGLT